MGVTYSNAAPSNLTDCLAVQHVQLEEASLTGMWLQQTHKAMSGNPAEPSVDRAVRLSQHGSFAVQL